MPHFPVWLGKTANTIWLNLFLCVAQITFTTQSYPIPLCWHNGSLGYLLPEILVATSVCYVRDLNTLKPYTEIS
ncbi:hypothetical protein ACQP3C_27695, partial [Escherichia coli]